MCDGSCGTCHIHIAHTAYCISHVTTEASFMYHRQCNVLCIVSSTSTIVHIALTPKEGPLARSNRGYLHTVRGGSSTQQEGSVAHCKRGQCHTARGEQKGAVAHSKRGQCTALPPLTVCPYPLLLPLRPSYFGPLPPLTVGHVPLLLCAIAPSHCVLLPPLTV